LAASPKAAAENSTSDAVATILDALMLISCRIRCPTRKVRALWATWGGPW
jgi:hypothetical protein